MNSIFTEENLLAFTTAARFGSFSKAADELGLTTSAISYTIKRMEAGLDVVLFTRNTRSIELTESGYYLFRKATDLLNDFHAIKRSIDTISQGIEARVRICINQLLYTPRHTARLLQVLKNSFPPARSPSPPRYTTASGIRSSITRRILPSARRIRYLTAAVSIIPRSARSAGCLLLPRIIRWRLCPNLFQKASYACIPISWLRTPPVRSIKRSVGCCMARRRSWFPTSIPNVSVRSSAKGSASYPTIWLMKPLRRICW